MLYLLMTCLLVFATSQIFALRDGIDDFSKAIKACFGKLDDAAAAVIGDISIEDYLEEGNSVINDFYECVFNKSGYVNNNKINFDILKIALLKTSQIQKENVEIAIRKCKVVQGINLGDTIVKVLNCLAKNKARP